MTTVCFAALGTDQFRKERDMTANPRLLAAIRRRRRRRLPAAAGRLSAPGSPATAGRRVPATAARRLSAAAAGQLSAASAQRRLPAAPAQADRVSAAPAPRVAALPKEAYTPWFTRVLAWLIDSLPAVHRPGIGQGIAIGTGDNACVSTGRTSYGI